MAPIIIHLDTSDYAEMYRAKDGTPPARIRDDLLARAAKGEIAIGLSYHVVFELLQYAPPKYRNDRLARADLLKALCWPYAFPYPTDLGAGYRFSNDGLWVPRIDLEDIEIERLIEHLMQAMAGDEELPADLQKIARNRLYFSSWSRAEPARFVEIALHYWPVLFGQSFVADGGLQRYLAGMLSRAAANSALRFFIADPRSVYETWFESYEWDNPAIERRDNIARKMKEMLAGLEKMLADHKELKANIEAVLAMPGEGKLSDEDHAAILEVKEKARTFRDEITSVEELAEHPGWVKLFGKDGARIGATIYYGFHREKRAIKDSDAIDLVHAMYLPHADLWRGDRAFSDLLIRNRVPFYERVVPTLAGLPQRIEELTANTGWRLRP
jgi:hypothetical protein